MSDSPQRRIVIYVDVDDTLVRSVGSKRIPMSPVVSHIRNLRRDGAVLYGWSSGGADYTRETAIELGIADCFDGFLPKPNVLLDDQAIAGWSRFIEVHPNQASGMNLRQYRDAIDGDREA